MPLCMLPHRYGAHSVRRMNVRTRKFIGTVVLIVFLSAYAILVMALAASQIIGTSRLIEGLFFFIAGLAWVVPAGFLIKWMQKPD